MLLFLIILVLALSGVTGAARQPVFWLIMGCVSFSALCGYLLSAT